MALQYKVSAVPAEEFSMDYVEPKVLCVSTHGRFTEDRYLILLLILGLGFAVLQQSIRELDVQVQAL